MVGLFKYHVMDPVITSPNVTLSARTTADSAQEGRLKVDAGKKQRKKLLKEKINTYIKRST